MLLADVRISRPERGLMNNYLGRYQGRLVEAARYRAHKDQYRDMIGVCTERYT